LFILPSTGGKKVIDLEDFERLVEIRRDMIDLCEEAKNIVRRADRHIYDRAMAYPLGHIETALDKANKYDTDLEDIICEVREYIGDEIVDEEDDEEG
jgi:hypothetical protein